MSSSFELLEPEAIDRVIVDEPGRLHERVADRRADEREAPRAQGLAHRARNFCLRRTSVERVVDRSAGDERPHEIAERRTVALNLEHRLRVRDRAFDLSA